MRRQIQDPHQRRVAAHPLAAALPVIACPLVLHDAFTLYAGNLNLRSRDLGPEQPCPQCGAEDSWGLTASPPAVRAKKLVRLATETPVNFCWKCLFTAFTVS